MDSWREDVLWAIDVMTACTEAPQEGLLVRIEKHYGRPGRLLGQTVLTLL